MLELDQGYTMTVWAIQDAFGQNIIIEKTGMTTQQVDKDTRH